MQLDADRNTWPESLTPEQRKRFWEHWDSMSEGLKEFEEAIEESQRITAEDLRIIVR